jgi:hypothetical protein
MTGGKASGDDDDASARQQLGYRDKALTTRFGSVARRVDG